MASDSSTPDLRQIHDRFFKEAFSRSDVVADFIQAYLPNEFSSQLQVDAISRRQDSHIDEELGQHYVDLLFDAQLGSEAVTIVLLLEHKSYPEAYPHFQLNRYLLNYWQDQLKDKQSLRPIVPIIIYHGRAKWKHRSMRAYFPDISELTAQFLPDFQYYLINLTNDPKNQFGLLKSDYAKLTAGLLKTVRQKQQLKQMLTDLGQVIDKLAKEQLGEQFIRTVFVYIHHASELTALEILAIFRKISANANQTAMSAAETLIQQGMQQGVQLGKQEMSIQFIKGLLRLNMDAQTIAMAADMPLNIVQHYIELIRQEKPA